MNPKLRLAVQRGVLSIVTAAGLIPSNTLAGPAAAKQAAGPRPLHARPLSAKELKASPLSIKPLGAGKPLPRGNPAGGIVLDGTLGRSGPVLRVNNDHPITPDLGQQHGPNLFHSFTRFDLTAGESATFSGPAEVQRILTRVTGGTPSNIDGTLRSTIDGADLYFMNPAGVVFGPNASLDLKGGFAVTTADYLKLTDGGVFHAANPSASVLTTAPPAAFGFLGPQKPAAIQVRGESTFDDDLNIFRRPSLSPTGGIVVVGGDVTVSGGRFASGSNEDAVIVAIGTAGDVQLAPGAEGVVLRGFERRAAVTVSGGGFLGSDSPNGMDAGAVFIAAENVTVGDNDSTLGSVSAAGRAGNVRIDAADGEVTVGEGALLGSNASFVNAADAGAVSVTARGVSVDGGTLGSSAAERAGDVTIDAANGVVAVSNGGFLGASGADAGSVRVTGGGVRVDGFVSALGIRSNSGGLEVVHIDASGGGVAVTGGGFLGFFSSLNDAGAVLVTAANVTVDGGASTLGSRSAALRAGAVQVDADGTVTVTDGGFLGSDAIFFGTDSGQVSVTARGVTIDGFESTVGSRSGSALGLAGDVQVDAGSGVVMVTDGAFLGSDSIFGGTAAGRVLVTAGGGVIVGDGSMVGSRATDRAGDVEVNAGSSVVTVAGGLLGSTAQFGAGGAVLVTAGGVTVSASGSLGSTSGVDRAGDVQVESENGLVTVAAGAFLGSESVEGTGTGDVLVRTGRVEVEGVLGSAGAGRVGAVRVEAGGDVGVTNGGFLGSDASFFAGTDAGAVFVAAGGTVWVEGIDSTLGSRSGAGRAGNVEVDAGETLTVLRGGVVASSATSAGTAGSLRVHSGDVILNGDDIRLPTGVFVSGPLADSSNGDAAADITVHAVRSLTITAGATIAADSFGAGRAGSVAAGAPSIVVRDGGSITARSFTGGAGGGSVTVDAASLLLSGGTISATNYQDVLDGGRVMIRTKELALDRDMFGRNSLVAAGSGGGLSADLTATVGFAEEDVFASANVFLVSPIGTRIQLDRFISRTQYADNIAGEAFSAPVGFLSRFISEDLNGKWNLEVHNARSFDDTPATVTLLDWSLSLGGFEIGRADGSASGNNFASPLTVVGGDPGLTGGRGGDVAITGAKGSARSVKILGGSSISASTVGTGPAGSVMVTADRVLVAGKGSAISSASGAPPFGQPSPGEAGSVTVDARSILVRDGAAIAVRSDLARAGAINLQARHGVELVRGGITAESGGAGARGGDILVTAGRQITLENSRITSETPFGDAGSIELRAPHLIRISDSAILTRAGNAGGNILIDPQFVVLGGSRIIADATQANAGNITIVASQFLNSGSLISASSEFGLSGTIDITAPDLDISGSLVDLNAAVVSGAARLEPQCALQLGGEISSFVLTGRGGTAADVGGWETVEPAWVFGATAPEIPVRSEMPDQRR